MADPLRVVLVSSRNPLNIGAAARAMSNFGFTDLRVVNPYDVAYHEARSAVRSHYILEQSQQCSSVAEAIARWVSGTPEVVVSGGGHDGCRPSRLARPALPVGNRR